MLYVFAARVCRAHFHIFAAAAYATPCFITPPRQIGFYDTLMLPPVDAADFAALMLAAADFRRLPPLPLMPLIRLFSPLAPPLPPFCCCLFHTLAAATFYCRYAAAIRADIAYDFRYMPR